MWNLKCFVMPVIIGATGIVSKSLQKYLEIIPGQYSIYSLQKTATLGTSHVIRKVLQAETWSLSGGFHHWFKRRKPVTRNDNNNNNNNGSMTCSRNVCNAILCVSTNRTPSFEPLILYRYKEQAVGRVLWKCCGRSYVFPSGTSETYGRMFRRLSSIAR
jgi:hypothetical protein